MHTFKIYAPFDGRKSFIEMDGKRLEGVLRYQVDAGIDRTTTLHIAFEANIDVVDAVGLETISVYQKG